MNKKLLMKELKLIANTFDVKLEFKELSYSGWFNLTENKITINQEIEDINRLLIVFFHELAHKFKSINNIYHDYYYMEEIGYGKFSRIALRAEKETDRIGEALLNMYFPDQKFYHTYNDIYKVPALTEFWKSYLEEHKLAYEMYPLVKKVFR